MGRAAKHYSLSLVQSLKSVTCDGSYNSYSYLHCTQTRLTLSTSHGKGKGSWGPILLNYWLLIDSGRAKPLSLAVYPILRQLESKPMVTKMTVVNLSGSQNQTDMRVRFVRSGKGGQGWYDGGVRVVSMCGRHV